MARPATVSTADAPAADRTTWPLASCTELARTFGAGPTAVVAVYDVTLRVPPAARIALTGPSGSGKSTLLHMLAGLEVPTAGKLSWPGLGGHPLERPGRVGVVFQGPSLLPALTVAENVSLPMLFGDVDEAQAVAAAMDALARLGIADLHANLPEHLSGGQAQRVAVARVLAAGPALILADEPTGQLDHATAAMVIDALLAACDELDAALVVSTHDPVIAARLPQEWVMRDGTLLPAPATSSSGGGRR